ncbi:MAG: 6-pyruvoyl-tetrahydropterin synthase-related protein [Terriglobales bacterium]
MLVENEQIKTGTAEGTAEPRTMNAEPAGRGRSLLDRLGAWVDSMPWIMPCLIALAGSVSTVSLALFGFVRGDKIHLFWAKHFSDQLWAGNLYPQWLQGMNSGLGSPTFYFYGPVSYYITSLFFLVLPFHRYGWLQVGLAAALASVASGLAAYLWLRERCSRLAAGVAAILYTWLPYHLRIDHFERFAFAEYWGFVWMPLSLYFVSRLVRGHRKNLVGLAVTYTLLLMTHPPTALLFGGIPILYALVLVAETRNYRPLIYVAAAVALGTLMASAYLIPALTTQSNASMGEMIVGDGSYANNFLYVKMAGVAGPTQHWFQEWLASMTKLTMIAASMAALVTFTGLFGPRRWERFLWSMVVLVSLLMMHPLSAPVWRAIPLLQKIQFPWRFHILLTLALTAMIAYAIEAIPSRPMQFWRSAAFGLAMLLVAFEGVYTLRSWRWTLLEKPELAERIAVRDYPEYRPKWVPLDVYTPERVKRLGATTPAVETVSGLGLVQVENWSPTGIQIATNGQSDMQMKVRQFYYPTWTATLEDGKSLATSPSTDDGLLLVSLPRGQHQVTLKIKSHGAALWGERISLATGFVTLCLLFVLRDERQAA